jgi:hypothetical protein
VRLGATPAAEMGAAAAALRAELEGALARLEAE